MMPIKVYLDEDVHHLIAHALRLRSWEAITTIDAGRQGSYGRFGAKSPAKRRRTLSVTETTLEQFLRDPQRFVRAAQQERVLVTEAGRPLAIVVGLENKDAEDGQLEASPDFWRMIEERRRRPTRPLETAEEDLFAKP